MPYKNIEDKRACALRYAHRHKDKIAFRSRKYYLANQEEKKIDQRLYRSKNKSEISLRRKLFRQRHPFKELTRAVNSNSKKRGDNSKITHMDLYRLAKTQKCRCALTGDKLSRENISVDHIIPHSRGGTNVVQNIRLVTYDVNIMKNSTLDADFIAICKKVVANL